MGKGFPGGLVHPDEFHSILKFPDGPHNALHGESVTGAWKAEFNGNGVSHAELRRNEGGNAGLADVLHVAGDKFSWRR